MGFKRYDLFVSSRKKGVDSAENPKGKWVKYADIHKREFGAQNDEEMLKFLDGVVGIVEATREEQQSIWTQHAKEAKQFNIDKEPYNSKDWKSGTSGLMPTIGRLAGYPICVTLYVNVIDGHKILFVDATSLVVDWGMIRGWLKKQLPNIRVADATNWTHALPRN